MADAIAQLKRVLYGGDTVRFHTMHMNRRPDVAGHSFRVAWLCYILTDGQALQRLIMAALAHDLAEGDVLGGPVGMGDMPSPTKRMLGIRERFAECEEELMYQSGLPGMEHWLSEEERCVLKLADNMAGMLECLQERRSGNLRCADVFRNFKVYTLEVLVQGGTPNNVTETGSVLHDWIVQEWEDMK